MYRYTFFNNKGYLRRRQLLFFLSHKLSLVLFYTGLYERRTKSNLKSLLSFSNHSSCHDRLWTTTLGHNSLWSQWKFRLLSLKDTGGLKVKSRSFWIKQTTHSPGLCWKSFYYRIEGQKSKSVDVRLRLAHWCHFVHIKMICLIFPSV